MIGQDKIYKVKFCHIQSFHMKQKIALVTLREESVQAVISWVLTDKIKKRLSKYEVIQHGRPDWLGRQHLDIWIPELMVAVEYQGAQHDRPIEFFGGQDAHTKGKKRDARKVERCIEAGVRLIEVRPNYNIDQVIIEIQGI